MKKSGIIEDINKNFKPPVVTGSYETYYSPVTKQWEQRETAGHKVGDIGMGKVQDEKVFQKKNHEEPESIGKSKIDYVRGSEKKGGEGKEMGGEKREVRKETSKCKYIGVVVVGLLVLGAIASVLSYFFYFKPKYFSQVQ